MACGFQTFYGPVFSPALTQAQFPDGGQTQVAYNDAAPASVVTTTKLTSSTNRTDTVALDGQGRVSETQLNSDPAGTDYVRTGYDSLGRVATVSNPYRSTSDPTYGWTNYSYDALSRVTKVTYPDSNFTSASYSGNCATSTDPAGKARKICADALGRVTQVFEDPSGLNYETDYQYDALNNLTQVTQGSQTRTYQYDMLSRLTSVTAPESSTTNFYYTTSGNALCSGDPSEVCRRTDARSITTTYTYDALNRLTSKSYSDGITPTAYFGYDEGSVVGPAWTASGLGYTTGRLSHTYVGYKDGTSAYTIYGYDPMGRVHIYWQCTPNNCNNPNIWGGGDNYDLAGDVTSWWHPAGFTITNTVNAAQQITQMTSSLNDATHPGTLATMTYTPFGALSTLVNGCAGSGCTQAQETYDYNNRLQPVRMQLGTQSNPAADYCLVYNY